MLKPLDHDNLGHGYLHALIAEINTKREMYHRKFPCCSEDLETLARGFDSTRSGEMKSTVPSYIFDTQRNLGRNLKFEERIKEHLGVQLRSAVLALIDLITAVHHILEAPKHCRVFE